jgi:hypothetical protein
MQKFSKIEEEEIDFVCRFPYDPCNFILQVINCSVGADGLQLQRDLI